ncbi:MAG: sulfotransferase family 2 domain-containing protein [Phycisphaerales bacterium]|nr:sulfotransferase family 2 domain-containing protein [Phycisphaerales bacterium]
MAEPRPYYPRTLIFLHLPKAAGTTLQDIVVRQYPGAQGYRFTGAPQRLDDFKAMPEPARAGFDFLSGHVHFGIHRWVPGPSTYMTMLRDPVDRIISHYYFVLEHPEHYLHKIVKGGRLSLHEYIARRTSIELDNDQTRYFLLREHNEIPFGSISDAMLSEAKGVLDAYFPAIGLAERFDDSLVYLQCLFGWLDVSYERRNVTRDRPKVAEVPPATIDLIRETNRFDVGLYEHARSLFERRTAALGTAFTRRCDQFRRQQAAPPGPRPEPALRRPQPALH